jgi:hypothetical protein
MRERRSVFDHQHPSAPDRRGIVETHRRCRAHDGRSAVDRPDLVDDRLHAGRGRGVDLVDDDHVGHAERRLPGMVAVGLARPQGVGQDDVQAGAEEREIVVAAVPHDEVGFTLGALDDRRVVHPREYHVPRREVGLVLLALLGGASGRVQVRGVREALDALALEIAVGHRVTQHGHPVPSSAQPSPEPSRGLRLATAGPDGRDRDHRHSRPEHRPARPEQREVGAGGERAGGEMHDRRVRDIAVGEHHLVHALTDADRLQLHLVDDGDAVRVSRSRQRGRVAAVAQPGNLGLGERDHAHLGVVTVDHVEVVEVAAGRAEDDDPGRHHRTRRSVLSPFACRQPRGIRSSLSL